MNNQAEQPIWALARNVALAVETALASTAAQFNVPAVGVAVPPDVATLLSVVDIVAVADISANDAVVVRHAGPPYTADAYADGAIGFSVFNINSVAGEQNIQLRLLGTMSLPSTKPAVDAAAIAAFGPFNGVVTVRRNQVPHLVRTNHNLAGIIDGIKAGLAPVAAPLPVPANATGIDAFAAVNHLKSTPAKQAATRRLLETAPLADDPTLLRKFFTGLRPQDVISMDVAGSYDATAVITELRDMMCTAADNIDADTITLKDKEWEALALLQDPPFHLLNTPTMLMTDIGADTFSEMIARAAALLLRIYGPTFADALNIAGVDLANLMKQMRHKALVSNDMFKLIKTRVNKLHLSPLINPGLMQAAAIANPLQPAQDLKTRIRAALHFTAASPDFVVALSDAKDAASDKKTDAKIDARLKGKRGHTDKPDPADTDGVSTRSKRGKVPLAYTPEDSKAWMDKKPPSLPKDFALPCFQYALGIAPCKNQSTCQLKPRRFKHPKKWDEGLSPAQRKDALKWFQLHPQFNTNAGSGSDAK